MILNYLLFIIFNMIACSKKEKLVFAELHIRHGARAPNTLDVNGTGKDMFGVKWTAPGELTPMGKRMQYLLGLRNRQRYIIDQENFVSEVFDPHEITVYSTDLNRTLQSAVSHIQGFYPVFLHNGEKLEPEQCDKAVPPLDIRNVTEIEEKKEFLNYSALPYYMNIVPVHFLLLRNSTYNNCSLKLRDIYLNNLNTSILLKEIVAEFNSKYYEQLKDIFPLKVVNDTLNFTFMVGFCDTFIADHTEGKDLSEFLEISKMSTEDILEICHRTMTINFRDIYYYQDKTNVSLIFQNSLVLRDMINYMKRRVDDDILLDISKKNLSDFSKPKLVVLTGHESTLSAQETFFMNFFNLGLDSYHYPYYASQLSYEITREDVDDNIRSKLNYSNYTVKYYFNDIIIMSIPFDKFVEKVEKNIWSLADFDEYCYAENITIEDNTKNNSINTKITIIMIMGIIIFILVIVIVFLIVKLVHKDNISKNSESKGDQLDKDEKLMNDEED